MMYLISNGWKLHIRIRVYDMETTRIIGIYLIEALKKLSYYSGFFTTTVISSLSYDVSNSHNSYPIEDNNCFIVFALK